MLLAWACADCWRSEEDSVSEGEAVPQQNISMRRWADKNCVRFFWRGSSGVADQFEDCVHAFASNRVELRRVGSRTMPDIGFIQ